MRVTTVQDGEAVARRGADTVARLLGEAIAARGEAHIALAGGSSPKRCHELLVGEDVDWARVHVWCSDERCVPPDDEESNWRMIRASLLDHVRVPEAQQHRALGERGPEDAARGYEAEIRATVPDAVFDVVMCGMGPDGHTMSLFPGHAEVAERERLVIGVTDSPKPPPERVTFTLPLVHAARHTLLLVSGASKADALSAVLERVDPAVPASLLREGRLEIIADDAAAPGSHSG
jgi:6-phosphogluconolactonase